MAKDLDPIDRAILRALQADGSLSQRALAETVGLSQNACGRRLRALEEARLLLGTTMRLNPQALGLGLTVFVMIRTRHHAADWLDNFRRVVLSIPEVIDFYRIAGDYDYMLKVIARDMEAFDHVYRRLIEKIELDSVTSVITMEAIADQRPLPV